ncbi:hypothetical protein [Bhargavaea cecembensis]|uniref:hypothetical protein n=1 Tax=Bhargavaea cecembensis TaxID=394098 RepID=UPI00058B2583|nr:hypothetical protein [Bhargavaea cecembensis]
MKRWKGLFYKEWMLARPGIAVVLIVILLAVASGPFLLHQYISGETSIISYAFGISSFLLLFLSYMPVAGLFMSLTADMKRLDLWLHSPASLGTLVGVKALFALIAMAAAMIWLTLVLGIVFLITGGSAGIPEGLTAGLFTGFFAEIELIVLVIAVIQLAIGFLFWTIYQWLRRKFTRIAAVPVTGLLFIALFWVNEKLSGLPAAERVLGAGEFRFSSIERLSDYSDLGIEMTGALAAGGLIFSLIVSALFFWAGLALFDRKVAGE